MKQRIRYLLLFFFFAFYVNSMSVAQSLKRQSIGSMGSSDTKTNELYIHMTVGQSNQSLSSDKSIRIGFEQFIESVETDFEEDVRTLNVNSYPNPAVEAIHFDLPEQLVSGNVKVYNLSGRVVYENQIQNAQFIELNVSALNEGIYHVSIIPQNTSSSTSYVTKFVVSK